jgi:hypothetical protein
MVMPGPPQFGERTFKAEIIEPDGTIRNVTEEVERLIAFTSTPGSSSYSEDDDDD